MAIEPENPNAVRELIYINTGMCRWPEAGQWAGHLREMARHLSWPKFRAATSISGEKNTSLLESLLSQVSPAYDLDGG
ncbi:hypothetical protein [Candidatus Methylacidithermus pantelleriae]|uniref:Uncharacterized protein n=1 Tax=Candidatus Methylacidithermus pantelleriae TaxID=2744239 RepID=A0A8J2BPQ0_9BACT|nr:hypothetical protein [Candidatus Methylacidithermus pantelleriae]CAF0697261.1 hypothetical protein MPNT_210026 [Candidatus Methylacidithermus pantelleriae]